MIASHSPWTPRTCRGSLVSLLIMAATLVPFLPAILTSYRTIRITTTSPTSLLIQHLTVVSSDNAEDFPL